MSGAPGSWIWIAPRLRLHHEQRNHCRTSRMGSEGKMRNVSLRDSASRPQSMRFDRPSDTVPVGDGEMSAPRSRIPDVVPNGWLDRLFHVVLELPLAAGEDAVVEAMVDGVAEILPRYAVGACFVA